MASAAVQVQGVDQLTRNLQQLVLKAPAAAGQILTRVLEPVMTRAKVLCPVRYGTLRASGHVGPPVVEGTRVSVTLGFGGPAAPYALFVHENLSAHHRNGQAKFLEQAVLEGTKGLNAEIAADYAEIFKRAP